jgi:hypothetical protein
MANKLPSYKAARNARKGESSMEIEGVIDTTKPKTYTDQSLPKPGDADNKISPEPNVSKGWKTEPAPTANPDDWKRPGFTGTIKT